jgi:hypothetical protein
MNWYTKLFSKEKGVNTSGRVMQELSHVSPSFDSMRSRLESGGAFAYVSRWPNTNVGNKFTKNVKSVLPTPRFTA